MSFGSPFFLLNDSFAHITFRKEADAVVWRLWRFKREELSLSYYYCLEERDVFCSVWPETTKNTASSDKLAILASAHGCRDCKLIAKAIICMRRCSMLSSVTNVVHILPPCESYEQEIELQNIVVSLPACTQKVANHLFTTSTTVFLVEPMCMISNKKTGNIRALERIDFRDFKVVGLCVRKQTHSAWINQLAVPWNCLLWMYPFNFSGSRSFGGLFSEITGHYHPTEPSVFCQVNVRRQTCFDFSFWTSREQTCSESKKFL